MIYKGRDIYEDEAILTIATDLMEWTFDFGLKFWKDKKGSWAAEKYWNPIKDPNSSRTILMVLSRKIGREGWFRIQCDPGLEDSDCGYPRFSVEVGSLDGGSFFAQGEAPHEGPIVIQCALNFLSKEKE